MVWRYACAFYRILKLFIYLFIYFFFFYFFTFLTYTFLRGSEFVVGTLWAQLLQQFYTDPSETSHLS